ncbi:PAS domain-containing sensor histidine kinase, partial [bacterium]|nr:PAS domain-containing sensor histidine kinase [bacterium]
GIAIYSQDGKCFSANNAMADIINTDKDLILRQNLHETESWKTLGIYEQAIKSMEDNKKDRYEFTSSTGFGKEIMLECTFVPFTVDKTIYLMLMINDLTYLIRAKAERLRLISILESTNDMVSIITPNGRFQYINHAGRKMLGWSDDEDITEKSGKNVHPEHIVKLIQTEGFPCAIKNGIWRGETEMLASDGTVIPVSEVIMSKLSDNGKVEYFSSIIRDISEQKKAEEEIRLLNSQLEQRVIDESEKLKHAEKEITQIGFKSEYADITSSTLHNVKNILNSVKTSGQMVGQIISGDSIKGLKKANNLLRENFETIEDFILNNPKGKKLLEYYLALEKAFDTDVTEADSHIRRLQDKVDSIEKIISAQQSYSGRIQKEKADLRQVIEDALIMQSETMTGFGIKTVRRFETIPEVSIEKAKLMHILINLIKNSKEAMIKTPRDERQLIFTVKADNEFACLSIKDTGHGIAKENLSRVFTRGFTTKEDGHGFGLHSSMSYIESMGGKMRVESDGLGKGAEFFLEFSLNA